MFSVFPKVVIFNIPFIVFVALLLEVEKYFRIASIIGYGVLVLLSGAVSM
jgi:hypothetical protein